MSVAAAKLQGNELPLFMLCLVLSACCLPQAFGILALILQVHIQSYVVHRSTSSEQRRQRQMRDDMRTLDPTLNILRSITGTALLATIDVGVSMRLTNPALKIAWHVFMCYWTVVVSEYMVHRFIWHAHWTRHRQKTPRLFSHLHFHYVQHYLAHHKHALDPETKARMEEGQRSDPHDAEKKRAIEKQFEFHSDDVAKQHFSAYLLACSNHGFTIGTWDCQISTHMLYLICPSGFAFLAYAALGDRTGAIAHALSTALPLRMAIDHHAFHSGREALFRWANERTWFERLVWSSEAMVRKVEEVRVCEERGITAYELRGCFYGICCQLRRRF